MIMLLEMRCKKNILRPEILQFSLEKHVVARKTICDLHLNEL